MYGDDVRRNPDDVSRGILRTKKNILTCGQDIFNAEFGTLKGHE